MCKIPNPNAQNQIADSIKKADKIPKIISHKPKNIVELYVYLLQFTKASP